MLLQPMTETHDWPIHQDLTDLRTTLLDLLCTKAYREGDFTLSSGQKSTYYINGKQATLHAQGAVAVARLMLELIPEGTTAVAGLTLGADPIVSAVSAVGLYQGRVLTPLIIRKEAKGHGTKAYIEGPELEPGTTVAVLEDVVTTGGSALKAVERLRGAGYVVNQVISLVDREQGGGELYAKEGLQFDAVFSIRDLQARYAQLQ